VNRLILLFQGITILLLTACLSDKPYTGNIDVEIRVDRFEQDLFQVDTANYTNYVHELEKKYGDFLPLYLREIIGLIGFNDTTIAQDTLMLFIKHPEVLEMYDTVQQKYSDLKWLEQDLTDAFKYAKYYFKDAHIPRVITFIGGPPFCFNIDTEFLAIGLDGYMGKQFSFYQYFPDMFPQYKVRKFDKPYMVPNAINVWLTGTFEYAKKSGTLLDAMLYNGKIYYAMKKLLPDTPDSLIFGYSNETLKWLELNESEIWKYFIKNKLLFETDPLVYSKYVNDSPNTSGMPPEAPGNIGSWVGYRIVQRYSSKTGNSKLSALMLNNEAQQILTESKYKP
jgi:hypothetical protein